LTPHLSEIPVEMARENINLFVIPGIVGEHTLADDLSNYDVSLANSLIVQAGMGVLTRKDVFRRFRGSPGPFLLTLPKPIHEANQDTPLLLADLNGYSTVGYLDLVRSYQNHLVRNLPTDQEVWHPPWSTTMALALVKIGQASGQLFVRLASAI
jgi:hypothetical protein